VPPGSYTLVAWHKSAGFFRRKVVVTATGVTHVEFIIPLMEPDTYVGVASSGHLC
jgi:hypothetical protein